MLVFITPALELLAHRPPQGLENPVVRKLIAQYAEYAYVNLYVENASLDTICC